MKNSAQIISLKKYMKIQSATCPKILKDILTFAIFVILFLPLLFPTMPLSRLILMTIFGFIALQARTSHFLSSFSLLGVN